MTPSARPDRVRLAAALALALGLSAAAPSHAAGPAPQRKRVAIIDLRAAGAIDAKAVAGLSSLVASEFAHAGVQVIAGADIAAMLGFEKQRQLLGCSDTSCLVEMGGALGTDYMAVPEISEFAGVWMFTVVLLDMRKGQAVERVTKKAEQQRALVDLVSDAVREVLAPVLAAATPPPQKPPPPTPAPTAVATPTAPASPPPAPRQPAPPEATSPAAAAGEPPQATATAPAADPSKTRTVGIVLDVLAAALAAGGATCHYLSLQSWNEVLALKAQHTDFAGWQAARSRSDAELATAGVLYGLGAVALGAGLYLTVSGGSAAAQVSLAPTQGGALLVAQGGF